MIRALFVSVSFSCALMASASAVPFDPFKATGIDDKPGAAIPLDGSFADEHGRAVSLRSIAAGKVSLLAPVLHNCPNICGVTLSCLMDAIRQQSLRPGRDFVVVAFGIDANEGPKDAASSLASLRQRFPTEVDQGVSALTGTEPMIHAVTDALGYRYAFDPDISQYAHDAAIAVITPDGRLSHWLYGLSPTPGDLKLAVLEASHGRVGGWGDRLLLLCYHYDPVTGRYSSIAINGLRFGCAATMLVAIGAIAWSLRNEWRRRRRQREEEA